MNIENVNKVLASEQLDNLIVQSYDVRDRILVLAFLCDGGPKENQAYVLKFKETALFHLPSVLYELVLLAHTTEAQRKALVPEVSYDAAELSGGEKGFTVIQMVDLNGRPYGYYIASESVTAEWVPRSSCLKVW